MNQKLKALLFITILSLSACKNEKTTGDITEIEGFDYGRVRNDVYVNTYFNIKMDVPKNWEVQDDAQKKELMAKGRDAAIDENNEEMTAAVKASEVTSANLFTAFAHKPGTVPYSHNILLIAENLGQISYPITPQIYLANVNKMLTNSKLEIVQIDNSYPKKTINGMDFHQMNVITFMQGMHVHQTYLITIEKGFAFGLIYSYTDDTQKAEIEKVINTLKPYRNKAS